jgi:AcrR family transcriptional regulator
MQAARAKAQAERHAELVEAAARVFARKGVAATSVDDIVREAKVAKGTFYLYFESRDEIITAVAEGIVVRVAEQFEAVVAGTNGSPVEQLLSIGRSFVDVSRDAADAELVDLLHRPENRAVHDRISEHILGRVAPTIAIVIERGITAGEFVEQDPASSAASVLACYGALHDLVERPADLPAATAELDRFVLRGLGYSGPALQ